MAVDPAAEKTETVKESNEQRPVYRLPTAIMLALLAYLTAVPSVAMVEPAVQELTGIAPALS